MDSIYIKQEKSRYLLSSSIYEIDALVKQSNFDLVISVCEVNEHHGTGIFLQRIFPDSSKIISFRSINNYKGEQDFGAYQFCYNFENLSFTEIIVKIQQEFGQIRPRRILSIPYLINDFLVTKAVKYLFKCPLCVYIMDDQNIYVDNVPNHIIEEVLEMSDLRLGISRPLCEAYQKKYGYKIWFVPPLVEGHSIQKKVKPALNSLLESRHGVLIGNIWSQKWLDNLKKVVKNSGSKVDWYGKPNREWVTFEEEELEKDGIFFKGFLPDEQTLIERLREAPYAIVPTGSTNESEDRPDIAFLSLPSRIPFLIATANTPLIILGTKDSAAAKFVEEYKLGVICDYEIASFSQAVDYICDLEVQKAIRKQATKLALYLSVDNLAEWIWQSLDKREPIDLRFENLGQLLLDADLIITTNEVNPRHGTGALVKRIFADSSNIFSIRSFNHYNGEHDFGDVSLQFSHEKASSRLEIFQSVLNLIQGNTFKRILCIPYYPDEILTAIVIKELFNIPLATYIMDDQNICVNNIPDQLMREFLGKCSLRLATHPELRDAYEKKYGLKFWLLPAVVPNHLLELTVQQPNSQLCQTQTGALIGSIWSKKWFNLLRETVVGAQKKIDWYGNSKYPWLKESSEELAKQGINPQGILPEAQLVKKLRNYPYVIVPTGTLDARDDQKELSQLSLPGRIIFTLATSNTPIIILGSPETSAAQFVQHFGIGLVCDYNSASFRQAVAKIIQPSVQEKMRQRAASIAEKFSDHNISQWIWQSLEKGEPCDLLFEKLMSYFTLCSPES